MLEIKLPKKVALPNSNDIQRAITKLINDVAKNFVKEVQSNILKEKLIDRGILLKSVRIVKQDRNEVWAVSTDLKAPTLEHGRKKGIFPPVEPLAEWVIRKGIQPTIEVTTAAELKAARRLLRKDTKKLATQIAWRIAKKIQKDGTKARPFWVPAIKTVEREEAKKGLFDFAKDILKKIYLK